MENKMILSKLEELLRKQFDPTPCLLAGTQILFKFEEMYSHVKGLTKKVDAIFTKCEEIELKIAALMQEMNGLRNPDFDFGEMHLGS
jgi:hypothetical protein